MEATYPTALPFGVVNSKLSFSPGKGPSRSVSRLTLSWPRPVTMFAFVMFILSPLEPVSERQDAENDADEAKLRLPRFVRHPRIQGLACDAEQEGVSPFVADKPKANQYEDVSEPQHLSVPWARF